MTKRISRLSATGTAAGAASAAAGVGAGLRHSGIVVGGSGGGDGGIPVMAGGGEGSGFPVLAGAVSADDHRGGLQDLNRFSDLQVAADTAAGPGQRCDLGRPAAGAEAYDQQKKAQQAAFAAVPGVSAAAQTLARAESAS